MIRAWWRRLLGQNELTTVEQKRAAWSGMPTTPRKRFDGDPRRHQLRPLAIVNKRRRA